MSVYDIVTDKIIAELQAGCVPWRCPWIGIKSAHNRITKKPYSMLNQMLLGKPGEWASYDQWMALGKSLNKKVCIKKGSKASMIVFFKRVEFDEEDGSKVERTVLRYYKVFHVDDVVGIDPEEPYFYPYPINPLQESEDLFSKYIEREGILFRESVSNEAYYDPLNDEIHLPDRRQFSSAEGYAECLWHEATHSSGHASRLNRIGVQQVEFGSKKYGTEELIAEMGSAFMMHSLGIHTEDILHNNAAYIDSWIRAIKEDSRMVVRAAVAAEKAVNYIRKGTC